MGGKEYKELATAKIQASRNIVISENKAFGGFTLAQQVLIDEGRSKQTAVFMKGAIHVETLDGLYELRDALNEAIKNAEND
jgi:hypothetical protein